MAIYHLHVKVIGRKAGSSAVASAAYRSASRLRDDRLERSHDFSNKRGVVHSKIMLPENAPEAWNDRERLWNDVEAFEVRKDAQLAREVEFALPREMTQAQGIELARDFVQSEFVDQGMIADLNVHWDLAEDGTPKPHAHVMLTMRSVDENGFGPKVREWNRTEMVERWRGRWAELANERLAELDIDARIDHRSLEAQDIALEPQSQVGAPAQRIEGEGLEAADRAEMHREIARNNGARIIADPSIALDAITHQQSTFTRRDMAMFAHRHSDGIEQFNAVMGAMRSAPDLIELGADGRGEDRFTTREMIEAARERMRKAGDLGDDVRLTVERGARSFASGDRVMFLRNERDLGVKNGTLGTVEQVSERSMSVRTDDGRRVAFDLKDYDRIDYGYAATIHKAQGMTVDRTHVLATPGLDAHGSYVALSRHRDGMDLHYGRDDFADENRLVGTLSRNRAKDMASDYERADPAQGYAERRGITFRERVERVVEIVKQAPEKVRGMFDGLRLPTEGEQGSERKVEEDPEAAVRRARTRALVGHARAVDAIFEVQEQGGRASPEQMTELQDARKAFEEVRPHGSHDAEAAYKKNPELATEAASGNTRRAICALQLETELRTDPGLRADRFVERWRELGQASQRQYQAGDMSGYKATRSTMGDMAKSLERDPQMESLLANRKRELGISFDSGRSLGRELAFNHGIDIGRGLGIGL